jgi:hypothetical protein
MATITLSCPYCGSEALLRDCPLTPEYESFSFPDRSPAML